MAKKKKAVGNPARGFATTSIASKPKVEKVAAEASPKASEPTPHKENEAAITVPTLQATPGTEVVNHEAVVTAEELEAQLERDELQLLVEKHAPKVRRESRRNLLKFQSDRRILRSQSQPMTVHDWLPDEILENIIRLAQAESNDSNRKQAPQPILKVLTEEDAMSKLWTLDMTLRELGFAKDHVQPVLKWLCANAVAVDSSASIWGLQEALEWLAVNQVEDHSFSFEDRLTKRFAGETPAVSRSTSPLGENLTDEPPEASRHGKGTNNSDSISHPPNTAVGGAHRIEVDVSDLDSDLELDELIPTYLRIKGKLFEIDPDLVETITRKQSKRSKVKKSPPSFAAENPVVRKLLSQLQHIANDALFDEAEAEMHWPAKRNQIAQQRAARREEQDNHSVHQVDQEESVTSTQSAVTQPDALPLVTHPIESEDEADFLGGMFSLPSDETNLPKSNSESPTSNMACLRDFGKSSGLSPRRVLEEAVRSRDPNARLAYEMISPTAYACRHSLIILWSKNADIEYNDLPGVTTFIRQSQAKFEATGVAAISSEQSEGYISTAALFSISISTPKEEKTYLRLPANWKDLYREFVEQRQIRVDAIDREAVKYYRSIVQDQIETDESDGIVLTSRFKMRHQAAVNSSTSNSGYSTPVREPELLYELWSQKQSTPSFQRMLAGRQHLPVYSFRESILATIGKHQITIICGETGCGKSTQIPSFILEHELSQGKDCRIFCTEPRRISAISLAQRVSEELGEGSRDLGTMRSLVGYAIRLESKTSSQTRLVFATVGVVLRMLESAEGLQEVTHLIIDEIHERSIDTDFLLVILRSLMERRPDLKCVLMSATVDANRFSKYLNDAPIVTVPGRTFPVQTFYLEDAIELTHYAGTSDGTQQESRINENEEDEITSDKSGIPSTLPGYSLSTRNVLSTYEEYAIDYDLIVRLIEAVALDQQLSGYSSAVLVFLPGISEIRQLNDMLLNHSSFNKHWLIYPLHSTISSEDQQAAFDIPPPGIRKIVLATNIAETGVTIPDITCVIDTGKHKEMRFDERRQLSRLTQSFISRANAKQRRGRAGRVQEGLCFHLFTKHRHDTLMPNQQTPEMLRLSLQDLVMRTKICKLGNIEETLSQALDPPLPRNIRRAIDALIEVDALTPSEELTHFGRQIAKLPLDAHLSKLVLLASIFTCVDAAITIAAILSSKSPFLTPFGARQRADIARQAFKKGDSDLLSTYNAYKAWRTVCTTPGRSEVQFCHKNFLSLQNLGNIEDLKAQLLSSLVEAGFIQLSHDERRTLQRYRGNSRDRVFVQVPSRYDINSENDTLVNSVIATAFYPKILTREGKGWRNISNNQTVSLAPTSVNKGTSNAKFLSYYHIMQSSNKFYNAHSTSIVHPLPMVLMVAADMDFKMHSGVITFPGSVLRFAVRDWKAAAALKVLRRRVKEVLASKWKSPAKQISEREAKWLDLFFAIFKVRFDRENKT